MTESIMDTSWARESRDNEYNRSPQLFAKFSLGLTAAVISSTLEGMLTSQAKTQPSFSPSVVKALFFDVFGTLVDWRTGVSRDAKSILRPRGYAIDWQAFADAWRDEYQPGMDEVRAGRHPYT